MCRAKNHSVLWHVIDKEFERLLKLLTIDESKLPLLEELYLWSQKDTTVLTEERDIEAERIAAIAKCRKRIENARALCVAGDMESEEYLRIKEQSEREIAHWQARTGDIEQATLELALCVETLGQLSQLWDMASGEDKQGMVQMLFEYVEYDLDAQRITDFRLKPWADNFIVVRAQLYERENPLLIGEKEATEDSSDLLSEGTVFCP